jgi:Uma2 family endonuclease
MSVLTPSNPQALYEGGAVPSEPIWRFTVDQYHEMIDKGILTDDDPVELLEGWLVTKMSKKPRHSLVTQLAKEVLDRFLPTGWFVNAQEPITMATSEPEPDDSVIRGQRRQFEDRHPRSDEVGLLIEVADTTLQRDRSTKKRIYAREAIPVYWIVNLVENQIEVYTDPSGPTENPDYRKRQDYQVKDNVPLIIEGSEIAQIAVRELLPASRS